MAWIHQELKRPGVTLQRLHLEYLAREPDGYRYSQFCRHYHDWARTLAPTMRQIHRAGEKAFVDFSGKRPVIYDVTTGEVRPVELFVGALGASSYVYAEACPSQDLAAWITAHVGMVEFFGGAPAIFVPDNLRSGVTQACRYEPSLNRTLSRVRPALRRGRGARARRPPARQSRRRGERARRATLDLGRAAPPPLLQPRGAERRGSRVAHAAQRAPDAEARRLPPRVVRATRSSAAPPTPGQSV